MEYIEPRRSPLLPNCRIRTRSGPLELLRTNDQCVELEIDFNKIDLICQPVRLCLRQLSSAASRTSRKHLSCKADVFPARIYAAFMQRPKKNRRRQWQVLGMVKAPHSVRLVLTALARVGSQVGKHIAQRMLQHTSVRYTRARTWYTESARCVVTARIFPVRSANTI